MFLAKEQEWRKIIKKIRGVYSGSLTYAANWGEEFENVKFWDELDYIGLDCYYPLSGKENPNKQELANEFKKVMNKIEKVCKKYNKPMLFTEIGFRSVNGTWKNPHADAQNRQSSEAAQATCYEVVLEGIQNKTWCNGILWWKWASHLENYNNHSTEFTPHGKSGEKVVEHFFKTIY